MAFKPVRTSLPRVGFVGAGRLGHALAERWHRMQGQQAPLWSRRFQDTAFFDERRESSFFSIATLETVLQAKVIVAAVPSNVIGELASIHPDLARYNGALLAAGTDLPVDAVQRFVPAATVIRVVPILLPGHSDVPSLVLEPAEKGEPWEDCQDVLRALGPIYALDDEQAFESIMHLTSPFSVVVRGALKLAIGEFLVSRGVLSKWQPMAERVVWQALLSALPTQGEDVDSVEKDIETPGGITEAGLGELETLANGMLRVLSAMTRRADELRR